MSADQKQQPIAILKFINDYRMNMSAVKSKAFYSFHTCQLKCVKDLTADNEQCFKGCEADLTEFFQRKHNQAPPGIDQVYLAPSLITEGEHRTKYIELCKVTKSKLDQYVSSLHGMLDENIKKYQQAK